MKYEPSSGEITYDSAGITPGIDTSFNNVDISGSLNIDGVSVATIYTTSLSNYTLSGHLYTKTDFSSGNLDLSFQNVDISGTLKINNIEALNDISSGLGEIDVSFVGNSLSIDAKNMLYATKYFNYNVNSSINITTLEIINFKNNSQIAIYCDNSNTSINNTIVFRGSNNGGINNSKINFIDDISLNNTDSLITLTKINNTNLLMVSEFK